MVFILKRKEDCNEKKEGKLIPSSVFNFNIAADVLSSPIKLVSRQW